MAAPPDPKSKPARRLGLFLDRPCRRDGFHGDGSPRYVWRWTQLSQSEHLCYLCEGRSTNVTTHAVSSLRLARGHSPSVSLAVVFVLAVELTLVD